MEGRRKSAEQLGHREIGLAIADVDGGVEHDRGAISQGTRVAAPQIAVQQRRQPVRGRASSVVERVDEAGSAVLQRTCMSRRRGTGQLGHEALLAPERNPATPTARSTAASRR